MSQNPSYTRQVDHLGIIPARGGSQRLPGKNLMKLGGRSLIQIAVEAAVPVLGREHVCVSTDCPDIAAEAERVGARVIMRPAEFSTSTATAKSVVLHALDNSSPGYGSFCYLQPTSPLRSSSDIRNCIEIFETEACATVLAVTESEVPPDRFWKLEADRMVPYFGMMNRLDSHRVGHEAFLPNGAVYVCDVDAFRSGEGSSFVQDPTRLYEMPRERSIDIDTSFDLGLARAWMEGGDAS